MINVDSYVDSLEEQIAGHGVMSVELQQLAPPAGDPSISLQDRQAILVEMLRVWMEHRWEAGHPVTVKDCLREFDSETFSKEEIQKLQFEESRQRQNGSGTSTRSAGRKVEQLPEPGAHWSDFELIGILGVGAFSKVYVAKQHNLSGRLVALKLTYRETLEPQWLATLQHSAIVPVYSVHQCKGIYGICMPFLGNTTLLDLLKNEDDQSRSHVQTSLTQPQTILSTLQIRQREIDTLLNSTSRRVTSNGHHDDVLSNSPPLGNGNLRESSDSQLHSPAAQRLRRCNYVEAVCWIGTQLADALSYAHAHGVIHSDIKPANVLLGSDGQPRLLDFNVSYVRAEDGYIHPDMQLGGTLNYMSPEHRRAMNESQRVDQRSDIYSLGVVLFEMLTGQIPSTQLTHKHARVVNPTVSPAMSAIVARCLMDAPSDRYQSARELAEDLTAQLNHYPLVHQKEPSIKERVSKWSRRHPKLSSNLSIVAASTILIFALAVGFLWRGAALRNADWTHRMDMLQKRLPNSIAVVSSLKAAPDLEPMAVRELEQTIELMRDQHSAAIKVDVRLKDELANNKELNRSLEQLAWLTQQHPWSDNTNADIRALSAFSVNETNEDSSTAVLQRVRVGDYASAIANLDQRSRSNPKDYLAWWLLGDCQHATNQLEKAEQAYCVCVSLQPEIAVSYLNRALVRFAMSHYSESFSDYEQLLKLAPSWHWIRLNRAIVLQAMGRYHDAIAELNLAVENGYSTVSVYRLRSELQQLLGNATAAAADLQLAMLCEPKTDQHWVDRGLIQLTSNPRQSAADFQKAIDVNPRSIDAHQKLAYVYSELLLRMDDAIDLCSRLIKLAPWQPTHSAARAVLYARTSNIDRALADLSAFDNRPVHEPMVMYQIACAYSLVAEKTSQDDERKQALIAGMKWMVRALRGDPNILSIATNDPDSQKLRDQEEFATVVKAAKKLELIP